MVIFGGSSGAGSYFNNGSRYNATNNTWSGMPPSPTDDAGRVGHTAVWTGSLMIVWGGDVGGTLDYRGGRYDPSANAWTLSTPPLFQPASVTPRFGPARR